MCTFIYWPGALLSLLCLALLFNQSLAGVSNRTIDDVFGDSVTRLVPVFLPGGVWKDQTCGSDCPINPNKSLAHNGTYHSATYNPDLKSVNVTMNFEGTAIYVFLILAGNAGPGIITKTNCVFKLDGATVGTFSAGPSNMTKNQFNVLAFSKTDIPSGNHQLVIATEGLETNSYLNFDYAIYTHKDNTTSSSTPLPQSSSDKVPAGVIAGGVIGGVACLATIGGCFFFHRHQRRRNIKRINLLGDSDDDTSRITTHQQKPPPLPFNDTHPSQSNTTSTFASTEIPSNSGPQTSEMPGSSDLASETQSLSPLHPSSHMPPNTRTALVVSNPDHRVSTETQQTEINKRVTMMQGKIENLKANLIFQTGSAVESEVVEGTTSSSDGSPPAVDVKALRAQIRMLAKEVSFLQAQQSSPWTRNPTLEPPPDYTIDRRDDEWSYRPANV